MREQPIERQVQRREGVTLGRCPGLGQRAGEALLFGQQVGGAIAHAPRVEQQAQRVRGQQVRQYMFFGGQPRQPALHAVECVAVRQLLPLLSCPRSGRDQRLGSLAHFFGGHHLTGAEDVDFVEVGDRALVGHGKRGQPVDFVAPQVDAHWRVHRRGEHVDDRAAHGDLAAVLDLVLAAVADADKALDQFVAVDLGPARQPNRLDVFNVWSEALDQCPHRRNHHATRLGRRFLAPDPACSRSRHIVRSRRPMVSTFGLTRSNGRVSHAGNTSTAASPMNTRKSSAMRCASVAVGVATRIG